MIPTGWTKARVGDIVDPSPRSIAIGPFGSSLRAETYTSEGMPVIRGQNIAGGRAIDESDLVFVPESIVEKFPACIVREGDLVFPHRGAIGRVAIVGPRPFLLSSSMMKLSVDRNLINPAYLFYYFRGPGQFELMSRASTVGTPGIGQPLKSLREIPILYPPLRVQRAIAEVLGALDDKIAANVRLEEAAAVLIEVMHRHVVESDGTSVVPLMSVMTVDFGEPFKGSAFTEPGEGRPLIRIRDLKTFRSQVWTSEARPREILVQPGDVVVGMDAEFRPTWWMGEPGLLNQRVCRVHSPGAGRAFVREALRSPMARIEGYKTGTTVIHMNKADIQRELIRWPTDRARGEFDRQGEPILAALVASAREREILAATRDALLPGLMSGKIRVRDAERLVGEAV